MSDAVRRLANLARTVQRERGIMPADELTASQRLRSLRLRVAQERGVPVEKKAQERLETLQAMVRAERSEI